jgi:hypothetical protein
MSDPQTTPFEKFCDKITKEHQNKLAEELNMPVDKLFSQTTSPSKERDAIRLALAKAVVAQLTALNKTVAQANASGVRLDFFLTGVNCTPEIKNAYRVLPSGNVINIYEEIFE